MIYGHWDISVVGQFNPEDYYGFVYIVTNITTNRKYIGKKFFWFSGKKQIRNKTKAGTHTVKTLTESDWKTYTTSSKVINAEIAAGMSGYLGGLNLNSSTNDSKSKGTADHNASLTGSIAVTVTEVLSNGNLVVRGEKKLGLSEGTEVIQVSGVIRPQDIGPNGTVQSLRLANAQIAYRGTGDLANAAKVGWGTDLLNRWWPF